MTNHWVDIKNADVILIMGSNAAENHPVAFKWIMEAKAKRKAKIISVDPRFTRTSSKADIYAPMRSGTDIAFLGGMINYAITNGKYNAQYVKDCTNGLYLVNTGFQSARHVSHPGNFSGSATWDYQYAADTAWTASASYASNDLVRPSTATGYQYQCTVAGTSGATEPVWPTTVNGTVVDGGVTWKCIPKKALKAADLTDSNCVFQKLAEQYSVYTPAMVESICGTPQNLFLQICEAYCNTYADNLSATVLYAMGWTQHTVGSQNIRTASILQMLLGNMGVAGGGINALRGWHNVQGSTDHAVLFDWFPGYIGYPENTASYNSLANYIKTVTPIPVDPDPAAVPASGNWKSKFNLYITSVLKAWWPSIAHATSYDYLPKKVTGKNYSHISLFEDMLNSPYPIKGLFVWGTNPGVIGPDVQRERHAMDNLDWMVVCDLFETETATFWKRPGVDPTSIKTEVFVLPGAAFFEKKGSVTNSGRLAQWKDKACNPPGDALNEEEILKKLGDAIKLQYSGSGAAKDAGILNLNWPYDSTKLGADLLEGVAKEIHGYFIATGALVTNFGSLLADGTTACGNWLFSGTWTTAGVNNLALRDPVDYHPAAIGICHKWGYAWPLNRRIIYNRASVYQSGANEGKPLAPDKWVLSWNGTNYNGTAVSPQQADICDGYAANKPSDYYPYIMNNDGIGHLMGVKKLADGPFPEHWEPKETPLTQNPLTNLPPGPPWDSSHAPLISPYAYAYPGATYAAPGDPNFPIVCTTYRLSEHWHGGGMTRNLPTQCELMPEPFVEMSEELAATKGIVNGDNVIVSSARGSITVKACVTKRFKPFNLPGIGTIDQVGLPWHWGYAALCTGDSANVLTPHIGDANTRIPEYKAFLVNIAKIS